MEHLIQFAYMASAACFILALRWMSAVPTARRGVITGILRHWDMAETLRYAAVLGASATTAIGTTDGVFTAEQARAFLAERP